MAYSSFPVDLTPLRAEPGPLPPDGATSIAGVTVPAGRALPMPGVGDRAFWAAPAHLDDPLPIVRALQLAYPDTGLWPVLTYGPDSYRFGGEYPWGAGFETFWDMTGHTGAVDADGGEVLFARWQENYGGELEEYEEGLRPWPGITTPATPGTDHEVSPVGGEHVWGERGQLVLVPSGRPADVALVLGPPPFNDRPGPRESAAILRSWEDRYGALPLRFSSDRLTLAIRRPPRTVQEARAAAIEMKAFSVDAFDSDEMDVAVQGVTGDRVWEFWWD